MSNESKKKITADVKNINSGVIIVFLIFLYLTIHVISGLRREHLSLYEVQAISMSKNNSCEAVIVRKENNYYSEAAGYTNYYVRNGSRVAVGDTIYSVDENKNIYDYLNENGVDYNITEDDIKSLKNYIHEFNSNYNSNNYNLIYDLKNELSSEYANISDSYLINNLNNIIDDTSSITFNIYKAQNAGVISFFNDNLSGLSVDDVDLNTFNKNDYEFNNLYDFELKENNALVYKIIDDESWSIILNLTKEQYDELSTKSYISFTIKNDGLQLNKPCTYYTRDGGYFAKVDLTEYLIRYIKYRFLNITLDIDSEEGLKIPYSSITTKDFFKIPSDYYTHNDVEDKDGFTIMEYNVENKETHYRFIEAEIYYEDQEEKMLYVDPKIFDYGQYVYNMNSEELYQVSVIGQLEGVYNLNKGYAIFRRIETITKNDDYCIVKSGLKRSISAHDHIALHAELIDENVQIY